ncbi:hypothetical protein, unlikely [Trypanosoma brucei gambiense DAL972]|uniref:T. brucei spp.-specific protein n=1 Tax=Trypanosoma brucei gambiense (strain MHOM/CI/86/DAL972) TaxID=679716 RepID=C9ZRI8_TRYB9|nr:hypothetical protein, unlikely [Trypanosoma brucei gambiense DAL972]CBH12290.1 hypothetical protein, unlikely [Trypanosoma brucei gambiense DAL972]|eukprot:XP_011774571.1 hypothetical protein, unlikely [Trypanosoma brucei gambiense DAL972]
MTLLHQLLLYISVSWCGKHVFAVLTSPFRDIDGIITCKLHSYHTGCARVPIKWSFVDNCFIKQWVLLYTVRCTTFSSCFWLLGQLQLRGSGELSKEVSPRSFILPPLFTLFSVGDFMLAHRAYRFRTVPFLSSFL